MKTSQSTQAFLTWLEKTVEKKKLFKYEKIELSEGKFMVSVPGDNEEEKRTYYVWDNGAVTYQGTSPAKAMTNFLHMND